MGAIILGEGAPQPDDGAEEEETRKKPKGNLIYTFPLCGVPYLLINKRPPPSTKKL